MQEENVAALRKGTRLGPPPQRLAIGPPPSQERMAIVLFQRLSPTQMKERREKGLCYNYDEKWGPDHKCKAAKLVIMECDDSSEGEPKIVEIEPGISIHALSGSPNSRTMRLLGKVQGCVVVILIDTGSTHNFLDPSVAKKTQLLVQPT
ncbi:hypothetical protein I3843_07G101600, partial [Carya illinoinensis]